MMGNPKYSDSIKTARLSVRAFYTSGTHTGRFVPTKQAILAYANLKMQSNDFSSYLQGKQAASDVYGKVWVTVAHIATERSKPTGKTL
jgi:hypothetical protein